MPIRREKTRQRREQLRSLTRTDILKAAAGVFARGGFETAKMQDIAEAAGFGAASLYTYFPSKEAIFAALIEHVSLALDATYDGPVAAKVSFEDRLEGLLRAQLVVMRDQLDAFVVFIQPTSTAASAEVLKEARDVGWPRMITRFEQWIAKHSTAKERGGRSPRSVVLALIGVGQALTMDWMLKPSGAIDDLAPAIVSQVLFGIIGKKP